MASSLLNIALEDGINCSTLAALYCREVAVIADAS